MKTTQQNLDSMMHSNPEAAKGSIWGNTIQPAKGPIDLGSADATQMAIPIDGEDLLLGAEFVPASGRPYHEQLRPWVGTHLRLTKPKATIANNCVIGTTSQFSGPAILRVGDSVEFSFVTFLDDGTPVSITKDSVQAKQSTPEDLTVEVSDSKLIDSDVGCVNVKATATKVGSFRLLLDVTGSEKTVFTNMTFIVQ